VTATARCTWCKWSETYPSPDHAAQAISDHYFSKHPPEPLPEATP